MLTRLWRSLIQRRATVEPVDLDLHQQITLVALARRGPLTFASLVEELRAVRPTRDADATNAVLGLDAAALIEREASDAAQATRAYRLTRQGMRVARLLPADPRTAIVVYR